MGQPMLQIIYMCSLYCNVTIEATVNATVDAMGQLTRIKLADGMVDASIKIANRSINHSNVRSMQGSMMRRSTP